MLISPGQYCEAKVNQALRLALAAGTELPTIVQMDDIDVSEFAARLPLGWTLISDARVFGYEGQQLWLNYINSVIIAGMGDLASRMKCTQRLRVYFRFGATTCQGRSGRCRHDQIGLDRHRHG